MNFSLKNVIFVAAKTLIIGVIVLPSVVRSVCPVGTFSCDSSCCSNNDYCCWEQSSGHCSKVDQENGRCSQTTSVQTEDFYRYVMSEIRMAMELAQRSKANPFAEKCLKTLNEITPDSKVLKY